MENTTTGAASDTAAAPETADRIAALVEAVSAFNAPGLPATSQYTGVHADVSIHHLSDQDVVAALDALGVEYETRDGQVRGDPFQVYSVEVGEGSLDFYGQMSSERHTFGEHLAENAATFTEVQS